MAYGDMFEDITILIWFWRGEQKWLPNWNVTVYYNPGKPYVYITGVCIVGMLMLWVSILRTLKLKKLDSHPKKTLNLGYNPYIHGIFTY